VRFAGITHPGIIGTAPSQELLDKWNRREQALIEAHPGASPAVALPPLAEGVYIGQDLPADVLEKISKEGARTIPGREHGGNCDIKNLSIGSKVWLPVFVPGANLAVGDLHFSQGDVRTLLTTLSWPRSRGACSNDRLTLLPLLSPSPPPRLLTPHLRFAIHAGRTKLLWGNRAGREGDDEVLGRQGRHRAVRAQAAGLPCASAPLSLLSWAFLTLPAS